MFYIGKLKKLKKDQRNKMKAWLVKSSELRLIKKNGVKTHKKRTEPRHIKNGAKAHKRKQ